MSANKNILVLAKFFQGDLNPFDEAALEIALSLEDAKITVLAMAPLSCKPALEQLTRLGLDAILISDVSFAGSDTIATSRILATAISLIQPDLIFTGRQSVDGDTGQVPFMVSELTGFQLHQSVLGFAKDGLLLKDGTTIHPGQQELFTFEKIAQLRTPSIFSTKREIKILTNKELNLSQNQIGLVGSRTKVIASYPNNDDRRFIKFIEYSSLDKIIKESLNKQPNIIVKNAKKSAKVHYVGDIETVALTYGEEAIHLELENKTVEECIKIIHDEKPKIILWEENPAIKELASRVAIRLDCGLCADCTNARYEGDMMVYTRPAFSKDVLADVIATSPISMATIRKTNANNDIAIVIGRGAKEHLDHIKKLAEKWNAKIYCSRPVADEQVLDYTHQVGLTGTIIAPKICIDIGASGAVQHIAGINKSQTIIAINMDKNAPIFNYADYGIIMDSANI